MEQVYDLSTQRNTHQTVDLCGVYSWRLLMMSPSLHIDDDRIYVVAGEQDCSSPIIAEEECCFCL